LNPFKDQNPLDFLQQNLQIFAIRKRMLKSFEMTQEDLALHRKTGEKISTKYSERVRFLASEKT